MSDEATAEVAEPTDYILYEPLYGDDDKQVSGLLGGD